MEVDINLCFYYIVWTLAVLYNSVHLTLLVLLLRAKVDDQISWAWNLLKHRIGFRRRKLLDLWIQRTTFLNFLDNNVIRIHLNQKHWVVRWRWVNFQCRGALLIWETVGQGPTALAVGAGGGCLDIFFHSSVISLSFLPLSGRRPDIDWNTVSKGRETQNNQPNSGSDWRALGI